MMFQYEKLRDRENQPGATGGRARIPGTLSVPRPLPSPQGRPSPPYSRNSNSSMTIYLDVSHSRSGCKSPLVQFGKERV